MESPALEPPAISTMQVAQEIFPANRKMECPEMMEPLRSATVECPQNVDSLMAPTVEESSKTSEEECQKDEADISMSATTQEYDQSLDSSTSACEIHPMEATCESKSSNGTEPSEQTVMDASGDMDPENNVESFDENEIKQPNGSSFETASVPSMDSSEETRQDAENQGFTANECYQAEPIQTPTVAYQESILELPISTTIEYSDNVEMSKTVTVPVQTIYPILQRKECPESLEEDSEFDREDNTEIPMVPSPENELPSEGQVS